MRNNKKISAVGMGVPATDNENLSDNIISDTRKKIKTPLKVLIACEESQRVCTAFRELGHEAYSCDIQKPSGGHPEWHILDDVLHIINPNSYCGTISFTTMDGRNHWTHGKWNLIIAHPPCTYLSAAGAVRLYDKNHKIKDMDRYNKGLKAMTFFYSLMSAECENIAVENPVPLKIFCLPHYSQIIQPYQFGEPWQKRTCLWLKGLPELQPTNIVEPQGYWIGAHGKDKAPHGMSKGFRNQKMRSKTFQGIAKAMAEQWGGFCNA